MVCDFIPLKPTVNMPPWQEKARNNNVLTYVEQVTNQTLSFSFILQQAIPVRDLKPAVVKVYDYDKTDEAVFVEYSVPCNTGKQFTFHVSRLHFALKASPP